MLTTAIRPTRDTRPINPHDPYDTYKIYYLIGRIEDGSIVQPPFITARQQPTKGPPARVEH